MNEMIPLRISEKLAWIDRDAHRLTSGDLVEVKVTLKELIASATDALEDVRAELRAQRQAAKVHREGA